MKYLLDTSALLALHRREAEVEEVLALFDDPSHDMLIAALSLAEFGRKLRELGEPKDSITHTLDLYRSLFTRVVAIDEVVARASLELIGQMTVRLPMVDALIATAAKVQGATQVGVEIQ